MSAIHWFENPAFDAPELNSPQPCIHGAGCVYTKKTADGVVVPGVCHFVHPGEEGKGRALFPERTIRDTERGSNGKIVQPACVRLIGGASFYERMRLRMPWQAWCAAKGIPFTANKPGVFREPVKRIPVGGAVVQQGRPSSTALPIRHIRTVEDQDFLITGDRVTLLKPEEAIRFGLRPAVSAVPAADQSWPVLNPRAGEAAMLAAIAAAPSAARAAASAPTAVKPVPHAVVEQEVIEASAMSVWRELRRSSGGGGSNNGEYDSHDSDYYDNCDECGKPVDLCPERGDHGDERRELAEQAMLYYGVS